MKLEEGDRVAIVPTGRPGKAEPRELWEKRGWYAGHAPVGVGYARVRVPGVGVVLVHPESLVKVED